MEIIWEYLEIENTKEILRNTLLSYLGNTLGTILVHLGIGNTQGILHNTILKFSDEF